MTIIPPELRREIHQAGEQPVRIADPDTHVEYVIVKAELFDQMRARADAERVDPSFYEYGDFTPLKK